MMKIECGNCGISITWAPTVVEGRTYCCVGCANGGPCTCDYSNLPNSGQLRSIFVRRSLQVIVPPAKSESGRT
jgi:hypothetical protein